MLKKPTVIFMMPKTRWNKQTCMLEKCDISSRKVVLELSCNPLVERPNHLCLGFEVHLLFLLVACFTQHPLVDEWIVHVHGGTMSVVLDWGLCCFLYSTADLFSICICNHQFNMTGISLPLPACNIFDLSCKNKKHLPMWCFEQYFTYFCHVKVYPPLLLFMISMH